MFGGVGAATRFNDSWAYDPVGNTWTQLSPAGPVPADRFGHAMAYDPSSGRILMFGGRVGDMEFLNDMWAFDGAANTWTKLSPAGDQPAVRGNASMAYDPAARRMILFGGQNLETEFGDTWAYDPAANKWTELHPSGVVPTPRSGQDLVCDSSRVVLIMFGGSYDPVTGLGLDYFNETWTYDPFANIWTKLDVLGKAAPSPRSGQSVVYDPSGGRLIMFGGRGNSSMNNSSGDAYLDDTWACKL
jgi:N-acetylneuraminic acid mutarotase